MGNKPSQQLRRGHRIYHGDRRASSSSYGSYYGSYAPGSAGSRRSGRGSQYTSSAVLAAHFTANTISSGPSGSSASDVASRVVSIPDSYGRPRLRDQVPLGLRQMGSRLRGVFDPRYKYRKPVLVEPPNRSRTRHQARRSGGQHRHRPPASSSSPSSSSAQPGNAAAQPGTAAAQPEPSESKPIPFRRARPAKNAATPRPSRNVHVSALYAAVHGMPRPHRPYVSVTNGRRSTVARHNNAGQYGGGPPPPPPPGAGNPPPPPPPPGAGNPPPPPPPPGAGNPPPPPPPPGAGAVPPPNPPQIPQELVGRPPLYIPVEVDPQNPFKYSKTYLPQINLDYGGSGSLRWLNFNVGSDKIAGWEKAALMKGAHRICECHQNKTTNELRLPRRSGKGVGDWLILDSNGLGIRNGTVGADGIVGLMRPGYADWVWRGSRESGTWSYSPRPKPVPAAPKPPAPAAAANNKKKK